MKNLWGFAPWKKSKKNLELKGKPRFAGYALLEKLGEGGFGEVFYAIKIEEYESGQYVALKKLQETQDPTELQRFQREISILFNLSHPNVVQVLEFGEQDNVCFYTMEILQGETLEDRLKQTKFTPEMAVGLVKQVAAGLNAAHQQGIVHRDVKPQNIFLCQDGTAKILDFGLAKDPRAAVKITLQGAGGSPLYMPPEVKPALFGPPEFNLTPAYDQFALAAVTFEALSGERAFISTEATPVLSSIFYNKLKSLAELGVTGAESLDPIFARALAATPDERFENITEFAEALEAAVQ